MTVVGRADLAADSIGELIEYIKANTEQVTLAHAGVGAVSHLCGVLLQDALATKVTTVPLQGHRSRDDRHHGRPGRPHCATRPRTRPGQIKAGKVKAYAVTTRSGWRRCPTCRPWTRPGSKGFEVTAWHGLYAPKGTPEEVVDKLAGALQAALQDPKVVERFADLGTAPVPWSRRRRRRWSSISRPRS